jgi:hypothetical protein
MRSISRHREYRACERAGKVFLVLPARAMAICLCDGQEFFVIALSLPEREKVGYFSRLIYPTCSYDSRTIFLIFKPTARNLHN